MAIGVLRSNRNFLRFWTADLVSTLGTQMSAIALPLLVLSLGSKVSEAGLVGTCALVTRVLCRLPAGHLADKWDRRRLMLSTDLIRLVALGSVPLAAGLGSLAFGQLLVIAVIDGTASAAFAAASGIAIRDVVSDDEITDALSKIQASGSTIMLLGPVIGGLLFTVDRILPFTVDAISYALSAILLLSITVRPVTRPAGQPVDNRVTAGLRWLKGQPRLLWVLLFCGILNLTGSALEVGIVLVLRRQGETGGAIGVALACLGVGSIVGAVLAPKVIGLLPTGPLFILIGTVWTVGFLVLATTPAVPVVCLVLVSLLLFTPAAVVVLGKSIMTSTPRELLGRVNTAVGTSLMGLASVGPLLVG
ncbi:MAG: MFS transporter, partial [Actinomycetota bacterium]|nr:MFS transporter [Actinomycetota bacterium]